MRVPVASPNALDWHRDTALGESGALGQSAAFLRLKPLQPNRMVYGDGCRIFH
jgi:hypothetical protein